MSQKYPITISSWTLGDQCRFEERVAAARNAGFEGIGLRAETYVDALNEGLFDADILAILEKYGMKVTEVEYIVQWAEEHRSYEQKYKEQLCFHMCELFGVNQINCGLMETYSVGLIPGRELPARIGLMRQLSDLHSSPLRSRAEAPAPSPAPSHSRRSFPRGRSPGGRPSIVHRSLRIIYYSKPGDACQ